MIHAANTVCLVRPTSYHCQIYKRGLSYGQSPFCKGMLGPPGYPSRREAYISLFIIPLPVQPCAVQCSLRAATMAMCLTCCDCIGQNAHRQMNNWATGTAMQSVRRQIGRSTEPSAANIESGTASADGSLPHQHRTPASPSNGSSVCRVVGQSGLLLLLPARRTLVALHARH